MPDVSKEEIGRRMFQLHKDKSVERVIQKVKDNIGPEWKSFTEDEVRLLERLLGMAWANLEQSTWVKIPFASMTKEDIKRILNVGKCIDLEKTSQRTVVDNLQKVLLTVGCPV
jgi:hypothetical protein